MCNEEQFEQFEIIVAAAAIYAARTSGGQSPAERAAIMQEARDEANFLVATLRQEPPPQ